MRTLCCFLIGLCLLGCNNSDTKTPVAKDSVTTPVAQKDSALQYIHTFSDTALEDKITKALMKLPFVKKANNYIDSFSNHRHGISFMLDSLDKTDPYISVQAGYNGDLRFETYFHFYVNPKNLDIKVLDVVNDKRVTVKEYIKSQQ